MDKLYTRVSPQFDKDNAVGIVIASTELSDTYGFTELGYDHVDYTVSPPVLEVRSLATKLATAEDVYAAAEKAGINIWLTKEEYMRYWPGAVGDEFKEREFPNDNQVPNQLLADQTVQKILEEQGFDAFHDHIAVSNTQPLVYAFWKADSFEVVGPADVIADDPDHPYDVRLADEAASPRP